LSDTADLLRAIAGLSWVVLAFVVVAALLRLLRSQDAPLSKLGLGPAGVTMEFAEARFDEAVAKSDQKTQQAIGDAAKRSVIDRLQAHAPLLAKARILWVDDHPENNAALVDLLRQFGASVDTPRSNADAFELLGTSRYDVVISDVARDDENPGGDLKGVEFANAVFEHFGQRVLLFTARFDPAQVPGLSDAARLELVAEVQRSVFARTTRYDEALHYILDLLER
jgi:CheY-like chemotaxis protein